MKDLSAKVAARWLQAESGSDKVCQPYWISSAWVSPAGVTYYLDPNQRHMDWAADWLDSQEIEYRNEYAAIETLLERGWVRVSNIYALEIDSLHAVSDKAWDAVLDIMLRCVKTHRVDVESRSITVDVQQGAPIHTTVADFVAMLGRRIEDRFFDALGSRTAASHTPAESAAISLLRDAPDRSFDQLIAMVQRSRAAIYDPESMEQVDTADVVHALERMRPEPHKGLGEIEVFHATDRSTAKMFLRRGFVPETKPRNLGDDYAPGRGIDGGLYVGHSPQAVDSYGPVTLAVAVPKAWLEVPTELSQIGETDPMRALKSHDGAVINRRIPPDAFRLADPGVRLASSLTLYHGTNQTFDRFDLARAGKRDTGNLGRGIYLSEDPEFAMRYAEANSATWGGTPTVLKVRADVRRIATLDAPLRRVLTEEAGVTFPPKAQDTARSERLRTWFLAHGFDAVRSGSEIVVFDPNRLHILGVETVPTEAERLRALRERLKIASGLLSGPEYARIFGAAERDIFARLRADDYEGAKAQYVELAAKFRPVYDAVRGLRIERADERRKFKSLQGKVDPLRYLTRPGYMDDAQTPVDIRAKVSVALDYFGDVVKFLARNISRIQAYGAVETRFSHPPFEVVNRYGFRPEEYQKPIEMLDAASDAIRRAGYGDVLYGIVSLTGSKDGMEGAKGMYISQSDLVLLSIDSKARYDDVYTMVHEFGHRHWFKFLSEAARDTYRDMYAGTAEHLTVTDREQMFDALVSTDFSPAKAKVLLESRLAEVFDDYLAERWGQDTMRALRGSYARRPDEARLHFVLPRTRHYYVGDTRPNSVTDYGRSSYLEDYAEVFAHVVLGKPLTPDAQARFDAANGGIPKTAGHGDPCDWNSHSWAWIDPSGTIHKLPRDPRGRSTAGGMMTHGEWAFARANPDHAEADDPPASYFDWLGAQHEQAHAALIDKGWVAAGNSMMLNFDPAKVSDRALDTCLEAMIGCAVELNHDPEASGLHDKVYTEHDRPMSVADFVRKYGGRKWEDRLFVAVGGRVAAQSAKVEGKALARRIRRADPAYEQCLSDIGLHGAIQVWRGVPDYAADQIRPGDLVTTDPDSAWAYSNRRGKLLGAEIPTSVLTYYQLANPEEIELKYVGSHPIGAPHDPSVVLKTAARYKEKKEVPKADGDGTTMVYVYSERQVQHRNREKAKRVETLGKHIDDLRDQVKKDLGADDPKTRLTALAVGLLDATYERVGNENSADEGHYGVTGWLKKHVKFGKGKATISYVGKSGVEHEKVVDDKALVAALRDCCDGKGADDTILSTGTGDYLVRVTAKDVNTYLEPFDVTAKDVRGYHANREMEERLKAVRKDGPKLPDDLKEREKILKAEFKQALEETAEAVGHEPSTLKSQYLVPGLADRYLEEGKVGKTAGTKAYLEYSGPGQKVWMVGDPDPIGRIILDRKSGTYIAEAYVDGDEDRRRRLGTLSASDEREGVKRALSLFTSKTASLSWDFTPWPSLRLATKSDAEREDDEAERLIKPAPKKKPPRDDSKRRTMDLEDAPDKDRDLSMNYKDNGG